MELQEIGNLLKRERQKQGLSVDELMERTKISRRVIIAIEEGQQSGLPHPVYAKGFVKTYAGVLGLDPEEVGRAFSNIYGVEDDAPMEGPLARAEKEAPARFPGWVKVLAVVVVLALGAGAVLSLLRGGKDAAERISVPAAVEQVPAPAQPAPRPEVRPAPAADKASPDASAPAPATPSDQPATPPAVEPVAPPAVQAGPAVEERARPRATNVLVLSAFQQCWVRASVDGRPVERFLQPGQQMTLSFTISLSVRLGNAGGVRLTYNEAPYPLNAQSGEVRLLTFP
jgi:cytoskeleton protein RodZ